MLRQGIEETFVSIGVIGLGGFEVGECIRGYIRNEISWVLAYFIHYNGYFSFICDSEYSR